MAAAVRAGLENQLYGSDELIKGESNPPKIIIKIVKNK